MKILYIGDDAPQLTAFHRSEALRRLGHEVEHIHPEASLRKNRFSRMLHYRTGYAFASKIVRERVMTHVGSRTYDLVWIDCGQSASVRLLLDLRKSSRALVNYNVDDPTGTRDGSRWWTFRRAIPAYDLLTVVREQNVVEYKRRGARQVIKIFRSYDPVAHAPLILSPAEQERWASDVSFVGTWMPERGPFFCQLLDLGVPLKIFGDSWHKAREWRRLHSIVSPGPYGRDYVAAVQRARVCIGLVSKGNRDLHTQRSAEIPFIGSVFCAERTTDHESMYSDWETAVFWSSAEECAKHCSKLLADNQKRESIARAGRKKVQQLGLSNDQVIKYVIETLACSAVLKNRENFLSPR